MVTSGKLLNMMISIAGNHLTPSSFAVLVCVHRCCSSLDVAKRQDFCSHTLCVLGLSVLHYSLPNLVRGVWSVGWPPFCRHSFRAWTVTEQVDPTKKLCQFCWQQRCFLVAARLTPSQSQRYQALLITSPQHALKATRSCCCNGLPAAGP